jgi:hypothetical protein
MKGGKENRENKEGILKERGKNKRTVERVIKGKVKVKLSL